MPAMLHKLCRTVHASLQRRMACAHARGSCTACIAPLKALLHFRGRSMQGTCWALPQRNCVLRLLHVQL